MNDFDTIIIGTGCAGYNAADWLYDLGHRHIAMLTEGVDMGTSRNTGSDKQTYYKLSLASDGADSAREMAETLHSGGAMHGDTALVEAACSAKAFIKLALLGVPFPTNQYGEYVGYKTDHDPRQRATSCGPLTSKLMTEALERSVRSKNIPIHDHKQVIRLLTQDHQITGLMAIDTRDFTYCAYRCDNLILATGGPAGVYFHTVYPESQTGAAGLALEAGARMQNLCEWQYGLASVGFRWNVSGTYQQALPRYISIDTDGVEREFLPGYLDSPRQALDMVFLKGYQWPFDVRRLGGSSRVDMAVHSEINKGRRVYMDFRVNPTGLEHGFGDLSPEAYHYLESSGALLGAPIQRLAKMNQPAVDLYMKNGIDLYKQPLEVAVCAQHCNGGVEVDINWESGVKGLYAVGEAAGTLGVYRPGGSALNATQVGSMRAAEHIVRKAKEPCRAWRGGDWTPPARVASSSSPNAREQRESAQREMSEHAAFMRNTDEMKRLLDEFSRMKEHFWRDNPASGQDGLPYLYKSYDLLITRVAVLSAMIIAAESFGSRGSTYVNGADVPVQTDGRIVITQDGISHLKTPRPIPEGGGWFETVWREYAERNRSFL